MKIENKLMGPFVVFFILLLLLSFLFINFMDLTKKNYDQLINSDTRFQDGMNTLIYYNLIRENAFEKYLETGKQEYLNRYNTYLEKSNEGYKLTIESFTSKTFKDNYKKQYELFKSITDYELRVIAGSTLPSVLEEKEFLELKEEFSDSLDLPKTYYQIDIKKDIQQNLEQIRIVEAVIMFAIISTLLLIINQFFVVKNGIIEPIKDMLYVDTPIMANRLESRKIKDVMIKNAITVDKNTQIQDIAKLMSKNNMGSVFVVENNKPIGVITEEDILFNSLDNDFYNLTAKNIMNKKVVTIDENDKIKTGMHLIEKHKVRYLPVVSKNRLTGVVSLNDFGTYFSMLIKLEMNFIKNYPLPDAEMLMEKDIPYINWRASLKDAVALMIEKKTPYVVITTKKLKVVGIITERDFVRRVAHSKININKLNVLRIASKKIIKAKDYFAGHKISYLFYSNKIRRIPVIKSGKLIGGITLEQFTKKVNKHILNLPDLSAEKRFK